MIITSNKPSENKNMSANKEPNGHGFKKTLEFQFNSQIGLNGSQPTIFNQKKSSSFKEEIVRAQAGAPRIDQNGLIIDKAIPSKLRLGNNVTKDDRSGSHRHWKGSQKYTSAKRNSPSINQQTGKMSIGQTNTIDMSQGGKGSIVHTMNGQAYIIPLNQGQPASNSQSQGPPSRRTTQKYQKQNTNPNFIDQIGMQNMQFSNPQNQQDSFQSASKSPGFGGGQRQLLKRKVTEPISDNEIEDSQKRNRIGSPIKQLHRPSQGHANQSKSRSSFVSIDEKQKNPDDDIFRKMMTGNEPFLKQDIETPQKFVNGHSKLHLPIIQTPKTQKKNVQSVSAQIQFKPTLQQGQPITILQSSMGQNFTVGKASSQYEYNQSSNVSQRNMRDRQQQMSPQKQQLAVNNTMQKKRQAANSSQVEQAHSIILTPQQQKGVDVFSASLPPVSFSFVPYELQAPNAQGGNSNLEILTMAIERSKNQILGTNQKPITTNPNYKAMSQKNQKQIDKTIEIQENLISKTQEKIIKSQQAQPKQRASQKQLIDSQYNKYKANSQVTKQIQNYQQLHVGGKLQVKVNSGDNIFQDQGKVYDQHHNTWQMQQAQKGGQVGFVGGNVGPTQTVHSLGQVEQQRTSDIMAFERADPNQKNPMPTFIRMASNLRIKPDSTGKFDETFLKYDKIDITDHFGSRDSSVEKQSLFGITMPTSGSGSRKQTHQNRPSLKLVDMKELENSTEDVEATTPGIRQTQMPNLLGEYDCGDEPEEQDDSAQAGSDGESGESENDIENEDVESPCPEQKTELKKSDSKQLNQDLEVENQEEKEKPTINLLEYGDDELSKQSTQFTNNEHLKYMSVLNQGGREAFGQKKKRLGSKKKKNRKKKDGSQSALGVKDQINEAHESNDEEPQSMLQIQESPSQNKQNLAGLTPKEIFLQRPPNNTIILNYGPIPGRPPTIFFSYPPFLKIQRPYNKQRIQMVTQAQLQPHSQLTFRISDQTHTYNCVVNTMKTAGFALVTTGNGPLSWNMLWTTLIRPQKLTFMNKYQKLNHFAGAWQIGSKANLWRNVQKQRRKHGKEFDIAPMTYILPEDYKRWKNDREMNNFKDMYILKPTASSCGRGIRLIGKKDEISNKKGGYLVSKYIAKPHLLRGFKYDLRIYIVVTCFEPLKAYIFQDGLVRLATQPYSTSKNTLKKRYVHLTNYSINKKAENYVKNTDGVLKDGEEKTGGADDNEMNCKWSLQQLKEEYTKMGINYNEVFKSIKILCIKTLMAVEPEITTQMRTTKHKGQCFEIYGFDVIVDDTFRPWLLEVNVAPSLSSSSPYDKKVKTTLLSDTMHLMGYQIFDRKKMDEDRQKKKKDGGTVGAKTDFKKSKSSNVNQDDDDAVSPLTMKPKADKNLRMIDFGSPIKPKSYNMTSQLKLRDAGDISGTKVKIRDKMMLPSFLDKFDYLSEEDLDILASFEEESYRRTQTHFSILFPTRETIELLGPHFDCLRHANSVLWEYIRQKQPIQNLRGYFKSNPQI